MKFKRNIQGKEVIVRCAADKFLPFALVFGIYVILFGTVIRETGCIQDATVEEALRHVIPARKMDLLDVNLRAIQVGKDYQA